MHSQLLRFIVICIFVQRAYVHKITLCHFNVDDKLWVYVYIAVMSLYNKNNASSFLAPIMFGTVFFHLYFGQNWPPLSVQHSFSAMAELMLGRPTLVGKVWQFTHELSFFFFLSFYRAAWNADAVLRWEFRPSVCPSVRPSVCPSNAWIVTKRKKDMFRFLYDTKDNLSYFCEKEWLVGGDPFYLKFWVNRPALERNRRFWTDNRS